MTWKLKLLLSIILLVIFGVQTMHASAKLTVQLERDHILMGETVQLMVELDRQVSDFLDTSLLEKDFDILANSSGSRVKIINGQVDSSTTWNIILSPKHSGNLTIPSLEIVGEHSHSLTLQVSDTPKIDSNESSAQIFIETEINPQDPYVQSMARYTVRLLYRIKLIEGQLSEPQLDNALVHRIGEDRDYAVERDGHHYQVIERQYAIFPQSSGKLLLPGPVLDARIAENTTTHRHRLQDFIGGDPLSNMFTVARPVRIRGEAETLLVQPRPDEAGSATWLPAELIELTENWQPEDNIHVGDPIKRTLNIRALGLTGEQLPDLDTGKVSGFKVYPDNAKTDSKNLENNVEGNKTRSISFVPTQPGQFTMPAIEIHWWDTKHNQVRLSQLPERKVEILPTLNSKDPYSLSNTDTSAILDEGESLHNIKPNAKSSVNNKPLPGPQTQLESTLVGIWPWISFLFALLWLITMAALWYSKRRHSSPIRETTVSSSHDSSAKLSKKKFRSACKKNDQRMARCHLLEWAAEHWPNGPPVGLDSLAHRFDNPEIKAALDELDRSLYRGENHPWNGSRLAHLITELPHYDRPKNIKPFLPNLYT